MERVMMMMKHSLIPNSEHQTEDLRHHHSASASPTIVTSMSVKPAEELDASRQIDSNEKRMLNAVDNQQVVKSLTGKHEEQEKGALTSKRIEPKLSVVLPANQKSLVTPTIITSEGAFGSPSQLFNSLVQLSGQEVSLFTGLPSCTPTSADKLAASGGITGSNMNPFFMNVSSAAAVAAAHYHHHHHHYHPAYTISGAPEQEVCKTSASIDKLPEHTNHKTREEESISTSSTSVIPNMIRGTNIQSQVADCVTDRAAQVKQIERRQQLSKLSFDKLQAANQAAMLMSPLSFLLSPEQDAWLRIGPLSVQQQQDQIIKQNAATSTNNLASQHPPLEPRQSAAQNLSNQMVAHQQQHQLVQHLQPSPRHSNYQNHQSTTLNDLQSISEQQPQQPFINVISSTGTSNAQAVVSDFTYQTQIQSPHHQKLAQQQVLSMQNANSTDACRLSPADNLTRQQVDVRVANGAHQPSQYCAPEVQNQATPPNAHHQQPYVPSVISDEQYDQNKLLLEAKQDAVNSQASASSSSKQTQPVTTLQYEPPHLQQLYLAQHQQQQQEIYHQQQRQLNLHTQIYPGNYPSRPAFYQAHQIELREDAANRPVVVNQYSAPQIVGGKIYSNDVIAFNGSTKESISSSNSLSSSPQRHTVDCSSSGRSSVSRDITHMDVSTKSVSSLPLTTAQLCNQQLQRSSQNSIVNSSIVKESNPHSKSAPLSSKKEVKRKELYQEASNGTEMVAEVRKKSKGGRKKKQVTHEELLARKNRSKERNRVAAKRCRQKRKQFLDELRARIDHLNDSNKKILKENIMLKNELELLKKHHKTCAL